MDSIKDRLFPYERPRAGQLDLVNAVLNFSSRSPIIVVGAPTGFGKTISILYSAIKIVERGDVGRVLYIVRTRNELDPVIKEARRIGIDFTAVYSGRRMCPYAMDKSISNEGFWTICSILRLKARCPYYNKVAVTPIGAIKRIVYESEDHFTIAKNLYSRAGVCPYFSLLSLSEEVLLTIATYPYLFKERIRLSTLSHIDPSETLVIVDEAHNIASIGGVMGESIEVRSVNAAIEEVKRFHQEEREVVDALNVLSMIKAGGRGFKFIGRDSIGLEKQLVERISSIATDIALRMVSKIGDSTDDAMRIDLKILNISKFLDTLFQEYFDLFVSTTPSGEVELYALPISFEPFKKLIERFKLAVMMSGTPPSKEFLNSIVGIEKAVTYIDVEEFGAPNYVRENSITVVFSGATTSYRARDKYMYRVYAQLIDVIYRAGGRGIIMAVYPSYEVMWSISKYLSPHIDSIIDQGEPLSVIRDMLLSRTRTVLHTVAGGRLTEGIELIKNGESIINCIVIIGVPYPQPDDYTEMVIGSMRNRGASHMDYYREIATIRILQAVGRAIRSGNDRALIVLADRRYRDPSIIKRLKLDIRRVESAIEGVRQIAEQFYSQV